MKAKLIVMKNMAPILKRQVETLTTVFVCHSTYVCACMHVYVCECVYVHAYTYVHIRVEIRSALLTWMTHSS